MCRGRLYLTIEELMCGSKRRALCLIRIMKKVMNVKRCSIGIRKCRHSDGGTDSWWIVEAWSQCVVRVQTAKSFQGNSATASWCAPKISPNRRTCFGPFACVLLATWADQLQLALVAARGYCMQASPLDPARSHKRVCCRLALVLSFRVHEAIACFYFGQVAVMCSSIPSSLK